MVEEDYLSFHNCHTWARGNDNNQLITLRDHMNPTRTLALLCIVFPPGVSHFNFKLDIIQFLLNFHGLDSKNPYLH